jgi:hypothetical protein
MGIGAGVGAVAAKFYTADRDREQGSGLVLGAKEAPKSEAVKSATKEAPEPAKLAAKEGVPTSKPAAATELLGATTPENQVEAARLNEVGKEALFKEPSDIETARRSFERSYTLDPQPKVLFNLASANYMLGNFEVAIYGVTLLLSQAIQPRLADAARKLLGRIHAEMKHQGLEH